MIVCISQMQMEEALEHLDRGGIVIFPTDTVYGLGCKPGKISALEGVFNLKKRAVDSPLQLLLPGQDRVEEYASEVPAHARELMGKYWPGGLTVLLSAAKGLPWHLCGPGGKVGLRVPDLPDLQQLISRAGGALAATSANLSGQKSPWSVEEIPEEIRAGADYIIDAGPLEPLPASTVVDCTGDRPRTLRRGTIDPERLQDFESEV